MTTYAQKLLDPRWQRKRLEVLKRDNFTCQDCGDVEKTLNVHHIYYRKNADPWDYPLRDFKTLCRDCHESRHEVEGDVKMEFARLLSRLDQEQVESVMHCLIQISGKGVENGVCIMDNDTLGYIENGRWFFYAAQNKAARKGYDAVTGRETDWKQIDSKK